jgi:hypothetical protein
MINTLFTRLAAAVKNSTALRGSAFLGVMILLLGSTALMGSTITCTATGCSGNLGANPNALVEVNFTANANTSLTMTTTSYDGPPTPPGSCTTCGFDPVLWLFDGSTNQLSKDDDIDPSTKNASITFALTSGAMYQLVLSAFDQHWCVASTDCNGVSYSTTGWSNNGDFSGLMDPFAFTFSPSAGAGTFTVNSDLITTDYPVAQGGTAAVPEPTSLALLLTGGAFLMWRKFAQG